MKSTFFTIVMPAVFAIACSQNLSGQTGQESRLSKPALHPDLAEAESRRIKVINKASASTVCIFSTDAQGGGSGVIIDPAGFALSNYHVVDPCGYHMYCGLNDGRVYDAVVVGIDPVGDLALIQILGRDDFPAAEFGNSDQVVVGQKCFAAGNPFLLAYDFHPTITWGMVSGTNRYQYPAGTLLEYADCLQTDAAINPGNSGGPLFDQEGRLIGINGRGSFEKRGRVNVGVGYAISINQVKNFLGSLQSGRILDHASAGFVVATAQDQTVRITLISKQSDAYRQGLRYDSEIHSVAGRRIKTVNDFKNVIGTLPPHWRIPVVATIEDQQVELLFRLQNSHSRADLLEKVSKSTTGGSDQGQPIPESVTARYRAQRGFVNKFYNQLNADRWVKAIRARYNPQQLDCQRINLEGKSRLDEVKYIFRRSQSGIRIGDESATLESELPFENQVLPAKSKGLLNLLHICHELLFTDGHNLAVTYLGTAPFVRLNEKQVSADWGSRPQLHLLRILRDGTETHLYIDAESSIVAAEFLAYPGADRCVIEFQGTRKHRQIIAPAKILCHATGRTYAEISFDTVEFQVKPKSSTRNPVERQAEIDKEGKLP